jgi:hypothetical protein
MARTASAQTRGEGPGAGPPDWIEPELATLTHERFSSPAWLFERKLDGELRHSRFQGRRRDKAANEVVREIAT